MDIREMVEAKARAATEGARAVALCSTSLYKNVHCQMAQGL